MKCVGVEVTKHTSNKVPESEYNEHSKSLWQVAVVIFRHLLSTHFILLIKRR